MKDKKIYIILAVCFGALVLLKSLEPKSINWKPSFSLSHKIPYGNFILFERLKDIFPGVEINVSRLRLNEIFKKAETANKTNLLLINDNLLLSSPISENLLQFVAEGNNAFLAANYFSNFLLDTLGLTTSINLSAAKDTSVLVVNEVDGKYREYGFNRSFAYYFDKIDRKKGEALGWIEGEKVVFVKIKHGEGYFFLSSTPYAFTNYHMLTNNNQRFVSGVLSHLPIERCIWDEYYKAGRIARISSSPLRVVLASPSLKMAYYVGVFSLLIFMIFKLKRRQRAIPVMVPYANTSLDFIQTVGQLYYEKAKHSELVHKKHTFFLADIREKFGIPTHTVDQSFILKLAALSGIDSKWLTDFFTYWEAMLNKEPVTDQELIKLNENVDKFYKISKR